MIYLIYEVSYRFLSILLNKYLILLFLTSFIAEIIIWSNFFSSCSQKRNLLNLPTASVCCAGYMPCKFNCYFLSFYFQDPICKPDQLKCVGKVKSNYPMCIKSCDGIMITSYFKSELDGDLHDSMLETMKAYNNYKKWFKFPSAIKGKTDLNL